MGNERHKECTEGNDPSATLWASLGDFNKRVNLSITRGLLDSVYFGYVLSMGQLPSQILQPCTHNVCSFMSLPFGVMLALTKLTVGTISRTLI